MTPRFHCPLPLAAGATIAMPEGAAHHALRVLRLQPGDPVTLFNGEGGEYAATLERAGARAAVARIGAWRDVERESPLAVTVVQGLASGERMDFALQKAVELGAAAMQPVATARSVTRLDAARADKRRAHWRQVAIAACEQCGRNRIPEVLPLRDLDEWLRAPTRASLRLLFAPDAAQAIGEVERPDGAIELLVGAEGGLTTDEAAAALRAQFRAVRMGPRVLRTETAALAALSALNALWGDWR